MKFIQLIIIGMMSTVYGAGALYLYHNSFSFEETVVYLLGILVYLGVVNVI